MRVLLRDTRHSQHRPGGRILPGRVVGLGDRGAAVGVRFELPTPPVACGLAPLDDAGDLTLRRPGCGHAQRKLVGEAEPAHVYGELRTLGEFMGSDGAGPDRIRAVDLMVPMRIGRQPIELICRCADAQLVRRNVRSDVDFLGWGAHSSNLVGAALDSHC